MKKADFFTEIEDIFEMDTVSETTVISVDSLAMLSLIALFDENFGIRLTASDISNVSTVADLVKIVGQDKLC